MEMSYGHWLGHNGVHVHDPKWVYTVKYIGVSRDEYKRVHDIIMATDDVIKCYKKSVTQNSDRPCQ